MLFRSAGRLSATERISGSERRANSRRRSYAFWTRPAEPTVPPNEDEPVVVNASAKVSPPSDYELYVVILVSEAMLVTRLRLTRYPYALICLLLYLA